MGKHSLGGEEIVLCSAGRWRTVGCEVQAISPRCSLSMWCTHTHTHILFSIGDLQHLHEDLFCPEMLSSPTAVVACGIVNSLCNT